MSRVQYNNSTLLHPPEIKKIFCAYHPNEFLTNFCCDAECLMPLCPNCIVEHTEQHFLQSNKPSYVNLTEALTQTKQRCYQNIIMFQQLNKANDKIYDYIMGLRQSIHNQLQEDKQQIFKQIDVLFETYEQKLLNQTVAKYKELDVYDKKETMNISEFISQQIEVIHQQINILKGENCLAGLINFYKHDSKVYEDSIKEIGEYVEKHKKAGKISINGDQERLSKTLDNFCEINLQIEFICEETKQKEEEARLKASNVSKEGTYKTFAQRIANKQASFSGEVMKENHLSQSNQDYRNLMRRGEQYYKIEPTEMKGRSQAPQTPLPPYYHKQVGMRHHY